MGFQYSPNHRVTIYREANKFKREDISLDVTAISTQKRYGGPMGMFTVVTTFNRFKTLRYDQLLKPDDIILIELDKGNGSGMQKKMLGLVSASERVFTVNEDGNPSRSIHISGSDFGKILTQHHCKQYTAPKADNIGSENTLTQVQYGASLIPGGTPAAIIKTILNVELFKFLEWTAQYILTDLVADTGPSPPWKLPNPTFSYQDTIWSILHHFADEPYNKLHGDTGPDGKFHIVLEKCPFDNVTGKIERKNLHSITPSDIVSEQMGVNDHDRINYVWFMTQCGTYGEANGTPLLYIGGDAVQFDDPSIKRHGFRTWFPESNFVPFSGNLPTPPQLMDKGQTADVRHPVKERTLAFWNWYRRNHTYESGTMTIHGDPGIRAGDGVLRQDNGFEYFVEAVAEKYTIAQKVSYQATLHLTRGQKHA